MAQELGVDSERHKKLNIQVVQAKASSKQSRSVNSKGTDRMGASVNPSPHETIDQSKGRDEKR